MILPSARKRFSLGTLPEPQLDQGTITLLIYSHRHYVTCHVACFTVVLFCTITLLSLFQSCTSRAQVCAGKYITASVLSHDIFRAITNCCINRYVYSLVIFLTANNLSNLQHKCIACINDTSYIHDTGSRVMLLHNGNFPLFNNSIFI